MVRCYKCWGTISYNNGFIFDYIVLVKSISAAVCTSLLRCAYNLKHILNYVVLVGSVFAHRQSSDSQESITGISRVSVMNGEGRF